MTKKRWLVLAALAAIAPCAAQAQQGVLTERTLSLDAAEQAARAALERCRKDGYKVTVTVLNKSGRTKVVIHDDGAGPHTIENSFRKAYTVITGRDGESSGDYGRRIAKNPPPHPALHLQNITTAEGALGIRAGKDLVGSIGVSGAPGGDKDAVCAQVGIDHVAKMLGN